jgi:asparagine synthase (glutamine-hydrolysing)
VDRCESDEAFPATLTGTFHGLIADRRRGTVRLFCDRFGMRRLYYHESRDAFLFAAEAKAILAVRPELRQIDPAGLGELVSCGCVLENRSLFRGVNVLPGAASWTVRDGQVQARTAYFQPQQWESQPPLEPEAYYRELRDTFAANLPKYFDGHGRTALSLTGGLDTRILLAWHKPPAGSLPCYTFGGTFRSSHDVLVARQVAARCGQPHQVITVGEEFLSRFPRYAERTVYLSDACADVSRSADLYVNEIARQIAPVRMTGNYGGEVLRGVRAFRPADPLPGLFDAGLAPHLVQANATYARLASAHPVSFAVFTQAPWHHYGLLALEESQLSVRTPYLDNDLVRTVYRAPREGMANQDVCLRLIADGNPSLLEIPTDRGFADRRDASSAAGRALSQFSFKAEYAYDYGMPQWVAKVDRLLAPLRPERLFLGRHKFYHFRLWYRDILAGYVRDTLLDRRALSRPYIERATVESIVSAHVRGDRNYTKEIHKLLTLELLHRCFVDSAPVAATAYRGLEAPHVS